MAAIVAEAVIRISKKSLKNAVFVMLAGLSFVGIYFLHIPFPAIILAAGLVGLAGGVLAPAYFTTAGKAKAASGEYVIHDASPNRADPATWRHSLQVVAVCLPLWVGPLVVLGLWRGWTDIVVHIWLLFSKAAVLFVYGIFETFLPLHAVQHHLAASQVGVLLSG